MITVYICSSCVSSFQPVASILLNHCQTMQSHPYSVKFDTHWITARFSYPPFALWSWQLLYSNVFSPHNCTYSNHYAYAAEYFWLEFLWDRTFKFKKPHPFWVCGQEPMPPASASKVSLQLTMLTTEASQQLMSMSYVRYIMLKNNNNIINNGLNR